VKHMAFDHMNYVRVKICGENIAGHASVAYWDEPHRDFMHKNMTDELRDLASILGFDLVERAPVEQPEQIAAE